MKYIYTLLLVLIPFASQAHEGMFSEPIKCGTCMPPQETNSIIKICSFDYTMRHIMDETYTSPSGKFLIHYDISGDHAVENVDKNENGVPDYVDSVAYYADFAYQKEVVEMGYYSPLPEPGGTNDLYDIYLYELGKSARLYGLTQSDRSIALDEGDKGYSKYHSFIAIDNDYSPKDSISQGDKLVKAYTTDGIEALKVTMVHEFHHAIQYMYGNMPMGALFAEMTSTYMEHKFFPEIKDYYQYVNYLFASLYRYPFGIDNYKAGYAFSIFAQFLHDNYGDDVLKRAWELVDEINDKRISYVEAIDMALNEINEDIETAWKNFQPYMYFTGSRAIEGQYLDDAKDLPEIDFYQQQEFSNGSSFSSGILSQMEQRCVRFMLKSQDASNDTLDIMMTNLDFEHSGVISDVKSSYNLLCGFDNFPGATNEQNKNVFWKKEDPKEITYFIPYLGKGNKAVFIDYAFPNPYIPRQHPNIFIPIPEISDLYNQINIVVFSSNMQEVFSGSYDFEFLDNNRVVIDISDRAKDLQSGVYLYKISTKENDYLGKFVVKDTE